MSKLTPIEIKRQLQDRLNTLHSEAIANRQNFQLGKASGIGSLIFGGIGCAAFPPLGVPAAVIAGGLWLASVFAETTTTGRIMPLPWVGVRLLDLAAGMDRMATTAGMEADEVELTDYLSPELRTEYLLIRFQGEQLSTALSQLDEYEVETGFSTIVAKALKVFGGAGMRLNEATEESAEFVYDASTSLSLSLPQIEPQIASRIDPQGSPILEALEDYRVAQIQRSAQAAALLGSVDVESQSIPAIAGLTVGEFIDTTPQGRDVESAIADAQKAPTKADVLRMPLDRRADYLLKLLAEYGCDLRNLIGRPTLAAGGLQRSGKTTLLLLTGILEKAKGNKLFYVTRDNDLYPISFDGYANGSAEEAIKALSVLNTTINTGSMGSLAGQTWVLDEFSTISGLLPKPKQAEFWGMALTGFAKQGGRVRFAVHHKTASANGLPPGQAETFKAEIKMLWTDRAELEDGTYQPSGQYELLQESNGYYRESGQTFQIPQWLLTDTNPAWHNAPCPVRSLLSFFPEFDTRKGAIAHPLNESKPQDPFNKSVRVPQVVTTQPTKPADDPWQEYEVYTKEMNQPIPQEWNPQTLENVGKLIGAVMASGDPRKDAFLEFLSDLQPGKDMSGSNVDPTFLQITRHRKIINQEGVVI